MIKVLFNNLVLKILLIIFLFFGFGNTLLTFSADCEYTESDTINGNMKGCLDNTSSLVNNSGDLKIEDGFKEQIIKWIESIAQILSVIAVGSIVYGGLLMTISTGEDEKIKKGKDVVKWGMLGFLAVISAGALIALIVNTIYGVVK